MRKVFPFFFIFFVLSSCNSGQTVKVQNHCSNGTVIAEGKGIKVTLGDYRYTEGLLNPKARKFFSNHPKELLRRMINRRLVLDYVLKEDPKFKKEMEDFKKDYLSRLYVSLEAKKTMKPVSEKEIVERYKELAPKKSPKEMTEADRKFIRNELRVKHYDEAVREVYEKVEKKLKFERKGNEIVLNCCGVKVSAQVDGKNEKALKERLKEEFFKEYFYRKALEAGLGRSPSFSRMVTEYFAGRAVSIFRKNLENRVKVTEEEKKKFYEENRDKFKMPDRVQAIVFLFKDKKRALSAEKLLKSSKDWKKVAWRFGKFAVKPRYYYKDAKDPIGALLFAEGKPQKGKVVVAQLGEKSYATIYVIKSLSGGILPYEKVKDYIEVVLRRKKLRELEREKLKELWKERGIKLENLACLRSGS